MGSPRLLNKDRPDNTFTVGTPQRQGEQPRGRPALAANALNESSVLALDSQKPGTSFGPSRPMFGGPGPGGISQWLGILGILARRHDVR